tara:strand:- start:22 stop:258 length:237 start_codon:yes stop_codon:yes gene_type:complete
MIFATEIIELVDWVNANRPDQDSDKPYFEYIEVQGGYELPEDDLIEQGLSELNQSYSVVFEVRGHQFEIEINNTNNEA